MSLLTCINIHSVIDIAEINWQGLEIKECFRYIEPRTISVLSHWRGQLCIASQRGRPWLRSQSASSSDQRIDPWPQQAACFTTQDTEPGTAVWVFAWWSLPPVSERQSEWWEKMLVSAHFPFDGLCSTHFPQWEWFKHWKKTQCGHPLFHLVHRVTALLINMHDYRKAPLLKAHLENLKVIWNNCLFRWLFSDRKFIFSNQRFSPLLFFIIDEDK